MVAHGYPWSTIKYHAVHGHSWSPFRQGYVHHGFESQILEFEVLTSDVLQYGISTNWYIEEAYS